MTKQLTSRHQRILDAAARVVRREGQAATIEHIAKEADYSPGALYRHFPGKDAIFEALSHQIGKRMLEIFAEAPPLKLPFEAHLKWVMYRLAQFADEERDLYIAAVSWKAPPSADAQDEHRDAFGSAMVAIMQQGISEGVLKKDDPQLYVIAFGGMLQALTEVWIIEGPYDLKPHIDRLFELFLHGASAE